MGSGIWGFVSTSLLVTERQPFPEPQRRPSPSGPPVSRVKICSGVGNTCGGASAALKCGVDRPGGITCEPASVAQRRRRCPGPDFCWLRLPPLV